MIAADRFDVSIVQYCARNPHRPRRRAGWAARRHFESRRVVIRFAHRFALRFGLHPDEHGASGYRA